MGLNIKKFLSDEGLDLNRFGEWLEDRGDKEKDKDEEKVECKVDSTKTVVPKNMDLLRKFVEGVKGRRLGGLILDSVEAGEARVESIGKLLVTVQTTAGPVRIPKPMVDIVEVEDNAD